MYSVVLWLTHLRLNSRLLSFNVLLSTVLNLISRIIIMVLHVPTVDLKYLWHSRLLCKIINSYHDLQNKNFCFSHCYKFVKNLSHVFILIIYEYSNTKASVYGARDEVLCCGDKYLQVKSLLHKLWCFFKVVQGERAWLLCCVITFTHHVHVNDGVYLRNCTLCSGLSGFSKCLTRIASLLCCKHRTHTVDRSFTAGFSPAGSPVLW